mmetsp:Transcript_50176/g.119336  ORF Transcript_50176/g.119336 Transcript_50176/m.119336 type:complete len:270 (-) Transcript_50176:125-934(-)
MEVQGGRAVSYGRGTPAAEVHCPHSLKVNQTPGRGATSGAWGCDPTPEQVASLGHSEPRVRTARARGPRNLYPPASARGPRGPAPPRRHPLETSSSTSTRTQGLMGRARPSSPEAQNIRGSTPVPLMGRARPSFPGQSKRCRLQVQPLSPKRRVDHRSRCLFLEPFAPAGVERKAGPEQRRLVPPPSASSGFCPPPLPRLLLAVDVSWARLFPRGCPTGGRCSRARRTGGWLARTAGLRGSRASGRCATPLDSASRGRTQPRPTRQSGS